MWFDIICLIIVVIGFVFGFKRGFISQLGSVMGVVFGIICCNIFSDRLAARFIDPDDGPETVLLCNVMAYVVIFIGCYVLGRIIGSSLNVILKKIHLGFANRLCGAGFTTIEYALVFSILLNAWIGAFPGTELRSNYSGVRQFVIDLAPDVLGSPTVSDIYDSMENAVRSTSQSLLDDSPQVDESRQ